MTHTVEQTVRNAVAQSPRSMMEAARIANIPYTTFVRYAKRLGVYRKTRILDGQTENLVRDAVSQSPLSMAEAARIANKPFMSFKRYAEKLNLYQPNSAGRGLRKYVKNAIPLEEILAGKHPHYSSVLLKERLIAAGIKENRCEAEGCPNSTEWNGKPLVLTLDHIDGDNTNHRLENIRLLCPNCHSQTETFCRRPKMHDAPVSNQKPEREIELTNTNQNVVRKRKYANPDDYHRARHEQYVREQQEFVQQVLNSGIDFTKYGWVTQVASIINQKPQKVHKWMRSVMPDIYATCYRREASGKT